MEWKVYQKASLMHDGDSDRVMLRVSQQMREKVLKICNERSRRSLQLDIVIVGGAHFRASRGCPPMCICVDVCTT